MRCVMWESTFCVDFQGLWEEWDGFIVPLFPSGRHFHRGRRRDFRFVIRPVELTRVLLIAPFLAVGFDLRLVLQILLCLDDRERMTESLVLNDRSVADSLILAEHAVGKHATFRSDFERAVRELVEIDVLATQTFRELAPLQDDLLPVIGHGELITHIALLTMAQDVVQSISLDVERPMQVLRLGSMQREPSVEALEEPGQEHVASVHVAYVLQSQLLYEPILQRAIRSLHAALGLAGVRADDLDVQFGQRTAELRHT